jgi:hypothetical protein
MIIRGNDAQYLMRTELSADATLANLGFVALLSSVSLSVQMIRNIEACDQ